jgi:uncharacterized protein (TIGR00299 family) protein
LRTAYIDMIGGVSGDMLLGALLDSGLEIEQLQQALSALKVNGFSISESQVTRGGVRATLAHVNLDDSGSRTRHWDEFESTIKGSTLPGIVKNQSLAVFDLLAKAESAAHGVSKAETHLHELGTVDTLVDVVGVIAGLHLLGVEKIHASSFLLSTGTSRSSHGVMGATAAATAEIYRLKGAPVRAGGSFGPVGEAVTPTGAALVTTIANFAPVEMNVESTGYGAGNRNPENHPNVVGLWIGESTPGGNGSSLDRSTVLLESNIDDMTGEALGYVQESLLAAGALDVWTTPILMKKNRPAVTLSVLAKAVNEAGLVRLLMTESSTLGIRRRTVERYVADREIWKVTTEFGEVSVKVKLIEGAVAGMHPEYDESREIAIRTGRPLREVIEIVTEAANRQNRR